ncbi:HesA/MoeB/ThiF family protein [Kosakonia sp. LAM2021]|uniref:HesA/MoeB/ThiF family protein n=1 Tax=Kosakonia sp. LAM2021 TaxID=2800475 RepID=UPI001909C99A|nr:HesA/MoeB/ThiF family protein [Kosakonia sp. LAM2021]
MNSLSDNEKEFYLRHFSLPGFDVSAQLKIKNARVLVIGSGGLGAPCLLYLAGAGVGHIGIVDSDVVSASNLPRQVLFDYQSIGESKVEHAARRITALNPFIDVKIYPVFLDEKNADDIISQYDIVVDCTDNFDAKYLINDVCEKKQTPLVYASIFQYEGQLAVFHYCQNAEPALSYRDLFPEPPQVGLRENCSDAGVLGTLPGILGTMQAGEVIKIITGIGEVLTDSVMIYDSLSNRSSLLRLKKRGRAVIKPAYDESSEIESINFNQLVSLKTHNDGLCLLDVRETAERNVISIGGMHIPMRELPARIAELPQDQLIVCYCKSGSRSKRAILYLKDQGLTHVVNLTGGIMGLTQSEKQNLREWDGLYES